MIGSLFFIGGLTLVPAAVGVNPRFFMLDVLGLLLGLVSGTLLGNHLMWLQYVREHSAAEVERESANGDQEGPAEDSIRDPPTQSLAALPLLLGTFLNGVLTIGYPIAILPYYRAESTSDWERFGIVCVVHPLAQEFIMSMQRQARRSLASKIWDIDGLDDDSQALQMMNTTCECGRELRSLRPKLCPHRLLTK